MVDSTSREHSGPAQRFLSSQAFRGRVGTPEMSIGNEKDDSLRVTNAFFWRFIPILQLYIHLCSIFTEALEPDVYRI